MALLALVLVGSGAIALAPARALAQLEVGRRALHDADFQRALRAFDRAERTETLDRAGLVSLYEGRVVARFALGMPTRARPDLEALASLEPTHTFPVEVPPEVSEALAAVAREAGGGLAIELRWEAGEGRSSLSVSVLRDVARLVQEVRVHVRVGDEAWRVMTGVEHDIAHRHGEPIAAWVELVGPREVVLVHDGSEEQPLVHGALPTLAAPIEPPPVLPIAPERDREGESDMLPIALGVGLGAAAIVAVAVIVGVVFGTQTSTDTQPSAPIVVGF